MRFPPVFELSSKAPTLAGDNPLLHQRRTEKVSCVKPQSMTVHTSYANWLLLVLPLGIYVFTTTPPRGEDGNGILTP